MNLPDLRGWVYSLAHVVDGKGSDGHRGERLHLDSCGSMGARSGLDEDFAAALIYLELNLEV